MKLSSVREIKSHFLTPAETFSVGVSTPMRKFPSSIALGMAHNSMGQPILAVRCYGLRNRPLQNAFVEAIRAFAKNEVQVEYAPTIYSYDWMDELGKYLRNSPPPVKRENQGRVRPLKIGYSIGHYRITAGTLGCFAQRSGDKKGVYILSNNHVMANSNEAKEGDAIYQPGKHDGGSEKDTVAKLSHFVRLKKEHNKVDGAIALISSGVEFDPSSYADFGKYAGSGAGDLDIGMDVRKYGRTTGATEGKISAIEMDNVRVNYGRAGVLSFDNQIEIRGPKTNFSAGGDSGSVVSNTKNQGIGLLFAGGGDGETNRTYANDLQDVLRELKINTLK
jgi:hypothetical protein